MMGGLVGGREGRGSLRQGKEVWEADLGWLMRLQGARGVGAGRGSFGGLPGLRMGQGLFGASAHTSLHLACPSLILWGCLCP